MTSTLLARLLARPLPPPRVVGRDFDIHVVSSDGPDGQDGLWVIKVARHDPSTAVMKRRERLLANEQDALVRLQSRRNTDPSIVPELLGMTRISDGRPALIRRWVDGVSLAELVERALVKRRFQGARRWNDATQSLIAALFDAVHTLHKAGLVHNDLKPEDILVRLTDQGFEVTLLDLGLAAAPSESGPGGTVLWAAPERLDGAAGNVRSDIWALGAIVYLVLTGRPPYPEGDEGVGNAVDARLAREHPIESPRNQAALLAWQDLGRHGADVGIDLVTALSNALAGDPKRRPRDVPALRALFALAPSRRPGRTTMQPGPGAAPGPSSPRGRSYGRLLWAGLALGATVLGVVIALGPVGRALGLTRPETVDPVACEVMQQRAERLCADQPQSPTCVLALTDTTDCRARAALLGACGGP